MPILFVDDDDRRFKKFQSNMIGWVVERAKTAASAVSCLEGREYDGVFLDYDLDEEHLGYNGYGHDITAWIAAHPERFQKTLFVIHTLNREGRGRMFDDLTAKGLQVQIEPFVWDSVPSYLLTRMSEFQAGREKS